jgi:hypothetical protein
MLDRSPWRTPSALRKGYELPLYALYACRANGMSESFVFRELADDATALDAAREVLADHQSAAYVAVYCGDRKVGAFPELKDFTVPGARGWETE